MKRTLNFDKIKCRIDSTPISSKEALKNVSPVKWGNDIINGGAMVIVEDPSKINKTDIGVSIK